MTHGRKSIRPYEIAQMEGRWKPDGRREGNKSIRNAKEAKEVLMEEAKK